MVLMPVALSLLGRSAWWIPKWLDTVLPDVDVEGHALDEHDTVTATHDQPRVLVG